MNKYYSIEDYADIHNVNHSTISRWGSSGKVKIVKILDKCPKLVIEKVNDDASIIALMNLKGGCGKTTLSAHLAVMLSKLNYRVLLVDTDLQNQCRLFFDEEEYNITIKDVIEGISIKEAIYTSNTKNSRIDRIYSHNSIPFMDWDSIPLDLLKDTIEPIQKNYDFIILDTSPNFDKLARSVVMLATNIIIPMIPDEMNTDGMLSYIQSVKTLRQNTENIITGIVFNTVKKNAVHRSYIDMYTGEYPDLVYETQIPEYGDIRTVASLRTNVFDYREKSKASQILKKFTWETLRRL